jgi:putative addiction module killer protein
MIEVREHPVFTKWLKKLRDNGARVRILRRLARLSREGFFGDVKYFDGIGELRIDHGPGYRIYFVRHGDTVVILLCGGDKDSQSRDIQIAITIAKEV